MALPPPPIQDLKGLPMSYQLWFNQVKQFVAGTGGTIAWATISKAGSNLNELTTRDHASLQALQGGTGGQYYHLTSAQNTNLTTFIATLVNNTAMFGLTSTAVDLTLNSTHGYILVDSTAANRVITLPAATGKYRYQIKKTVAANLVTVTPNGADTIQGAATRVLTAQYESCTIYSDGSGVWYIESFT